MTGIADVPLIACQSGSMSDSATSSLESFHISSVDGTANPAYRSSPSDSDISTSKDNDGESNLIPKRGTRRSAKSPDVYTARLSVSLLPASPRNKVTRSISPTEDPAGNDVDLGSANGVTESGISCVDQHSSDSATDESNLEASGSVVCQHTSRPIGAKLVVTSLAPSQQNSVHIPAPLPHTCTSVVSNTTAISYSDSELIPQRNSIAHNVTEMVATEHQVTKQRPEVPQVFPSSSVEISGEQFPSSFKKPLTADERRKNRSVIERRLHHWHLQRSRSADDSPASRHQPCHGASTRGSRPKSGIRSRHLNHTVSSQSHVLVQGSADLAGSTPDSVLPSSSSLHPLIVSGVNPVSSVNNSSITGNAGNPSTLENSSSETTTNHMSTKEDKNRENDQADDGVFDEDEVSGNNHESRSGVVINMQSAQSAEQSASTGTSAVSSTEHRVPNRAILRRGSGE